MIVGGIEENPRDRIGIEMGKEIGHWTSCGGCLPIDISLEAARALPLA